MPFHPIHLAQTATARGWAKSVGTSAKDAQVINGLFEVATNPLLGTKTVYVAKRAGSSVAFSSVGSGVIALKSPNSGIGTLYISDGSLSSSSTVYGGVTSNPSAFTNYNVADAIVGANNLLAFNTSSGGGFYLWENAISTNFPTFSGDTHTNTTIDNIASTTGLYPGQIITGTGIQANTRIATITSGTAITTTIATTASATITITKQAVAKIIDADYPTSLLTGGIVQLDGYFFTADTDGNIYQSALNDPSSWAATDVLNADYSGDGILFLFKIGNYIAAAGSGGTIQYFYNAGNPTGSVLSAAPNLTLSGIQINNSPVSMGGVFYCYAKTRIGSWGTTGLYRLSGVNTFERVSDDIWSSIIVTLDLDLISTATIGTKHLVVMHSSTDAVAVIYDPSVNMFSFLQLATAFTSSNATGSLFTRASSSDVLQWAVGNTWTDESVAYTLTIQTEPQDMNEGTDATDTYVYLIADNESTGTAALAYTDDDYANWNTVGSFDMTATKKRVNGAGGQHNLRAYRVTHSANTGFRGQMLRVKFEPGTD